MFLGHKKPLNVADLECPTFGVGIATSINGEVYRTYGPPYLPIIIPPLQILSLDPIWQKLCTDFISYSPGLRSFAIFDPPRVLTPVAALLPLTKSLPAVVLASRTPDPDPTTNFRAQPSRPTTTSIPKATVISFAPELPLPESKSSANSGESNFVDPQTAKSKEAKLSILTTASGQGGDAKKEAQNIGALILSAFGRGKAGGAAAGFSNSVLPNVPSAEAHNSGANKDGIPTIATHLAPQVLTVAGQIFTANPSVITIAGATILPGGLGITISGTPISLARSGTLFLDNSPIPITDDPSVPKFVFTIGDQIATAHPTGFVLAGSGIVPGGAPITVFGTRVSLDPSGIVVIGDSSINVLAPTSASNVFTVGGQIFTADPNGFALANSGVLPGSLPITISGTRVSLGPSGMLVIGDSSISLLTPTPTLNVFNVGGQKFTANPTGFPLARSTLLPGGAPMTISGTPISLADSGLLIIGSSSIALPTPPPVSHVFTAGGMVFTAASSAIIIEGTTLLPGGPTATILGTLISLKAATDSNLLIVGTSSFYLPTHTTSSDIFNVGNLTFTVQSLGAVVDGLTLVPGGSAATILGTPVSLEAGGETLVVGSRVVPLGTSWPSATEKGNATLQSFDSGQTRGIETPGSLLVTILLIVVSVNVEIGTVRG